MELFLTVVHIIVSFVLVIFILLQSGKGGGMGAGFGGAAAAGQQIFGGRGAAGFLGKATVGVAAIFMATSLSLAYLSSQPRSAMDLAGQPGSSFGNQVEEVIETGSGAPQAAPQIDAPTPAPVVEEAPVQEAPAEQADEAPAAPADDDSTE